MAEICEVCDISEFQAIARFFENNLESIKFLRSHGILPSSVKCGNCGNSCTLRQDKPIWQCNFRIPIPRTKKKRLLTFQLRDYKGTFE